MGPSGSTRRGRRGRSRYNTSQHTNSHPLLETINRGFQTKFRDHGRRISRHQISTLLICSLVITSLFYPAVGIYFWASKGGPGVIRGDAASVWRSLSTPFMDSFVGSGRKHITSLSDLRMIWDDASDFNALDVRDARDSYGTRVAQQILKSFPTDAPDTDVADSRPTCKTIRVEHVFVTTEEVMAGLGPRFGVLDKPVLQSALKLQTAIQDQVSPSIASGIKTPASSELVPASSSDSDLNFTCIRALRTSPTTSSMGAAASDPTCLVLSPLEYWHMSPDRIQADPEPAKSVLKSSLNSTSQGVPLTVKTTLAGRWHLFKKLPRAEYLALTFFLVSEDDQSCGYETRHPPFKKSASESATVSQFHARWLKLLRSVTSGQVGLVPSQQTVSHELVLRFAPRQPYSSWNRGHILLLSGYALALAYISRGLIKMRKVHSRFGMAFSGLTEVVISMITSISICALLGIRLTLVPWELLPFVVLVVGSENMFIMTNAVVNTPLSLTVPARIAHGLGNIGGPIMMTTLADITLLGTISLFIGVRAVKEFCVFAIMSLVMDFFLQMTFIITILSIDMQRLELADLLTQGARSSQAERRKEIDESSQNSKAEQTNESEPSSGFIRASFRAIWRARTARTASLALIVAFMTGLYLYYGTGFPGQETESYTLDPALLQRYTGVPTKQNQATDSAMPTFDPYAHLGSDGPPLPWWMSSPSAQMWQLLNPEGARQVRVIVEPWTILSLRSPSTGKSALPGRQSFAGWALFRPRIRAVVWFAKLVILPISGTTALLWMVLLYLLKDTELLDAQRDKSEAEDDDPSNLEGKGNEDDDVPADVAVLSGRHDADVELVAESDGVLVSIDTLGFIRIHQLPRDDGTEHPSTRLSAIRACKEVDVSPITALAVSTKADTIAFGLASGRICLASLTTLKFVIEVKPGTAAGAVQHLVIQYREGLPDVQSVQVCSFHRNGSAYQWKPKREEPAEIVSSKEGAHWITLPVDTHALDTPRGSGTMPTFAFAASDGRLEIVRQISSQMPLEKLFEMPEGDKASFRSAAICSLPRRSAAASAPDGDGAMLLLGQSNGCLRAWDLTTKALIASLDLGDGPVTKVRVVHDEEQTSCIVIASTSTRVSLLLLSAETFLGGGLEPSLTNGSLNGLGGGSPLKIRTPNGSNLSSSSFWAGGSGPTTPTQELANPPAYPISSHGNAARLRRASGHGRDRSGIGSEISTASSLGVSASSSLTSGEMNNQEERQLRLVGIIRSERGGCELLHPSRIMMGVRRRRKTPVRSQLLARRAQTDQTGNGEVGPAVSRWELWRLDLRAELVLGRDGELVVPRKVLDIDSSDVGGMDHANGQVQANTRPSRLRFAPLAAMAEGIALQNLAFSRLHPMRGAFDVETQTGTLIFGFGGSLGCISTKAEPAGSVDSEATRYGSQRRTQVSRGNSSLAASVTGVSDGSGFVVM